MIENLAKYLDLANHHPDTTDNQIKDLCEKVLKYGFNSAFVNSYYVPFCRQIMGDSLSLDKQRLGKVGTVISFPLGGDSVSMKVAAARSAVLAGADELDVSLNVGFLKEAKWEASLGEMREIVMAVRHLEKRTIIKFIPETGFLTDEEIIKSAQLILESGADFYKTCSGLGPRGAEIKDVELVRKVVGDKLKIKVAGGVTTYDQAVAFIKAGADRIGTSHAVEILQGSNEEKGKGGE